MIFKIFSQVFGGKYVRFIYAEILKYFVENIAVRLQIGKWILFLSIITFFYFNCNIF